MQNQMEKAYKLWKACKIDKRITEWKEYITEWKEPITEWKKNITEWKKRGTDLNNHKTEYNERITNRKEPLTEWKECIIKWKERIIKWKGSIKTIVKRICFAHKAVSAFHIHMLFRKDFCCILACVHTALMLSIT